MIPTKATHAYHIAIGRYSVSDIGILAKMFQLRGRALVALGKVIEGIHFRKIRGPAPMPSAEWSRFLRQMDRLRAECSDLELPIATALTTEKLAEMKGFQRPMSWADASLEFVALTRVLLTELDQRVCLLISPDRTRYWSPNIPPPIQERFGSVSSELVQASVCIAVESYTAAVFHSMRGLEIVLGVVARRFGVPHEREQWHNMIEGIESKIGDMKKLPKGVSKSEDQQFYSEAAKEFAYFKDAWRNHAAHSRATYGFTDASKVYSHVSEFVAHIAKRLSEND